MNLKEMRLEVTTETDGTGSKEATEAVLGRLYAVQWIDGDFADGVDAVVSTINHEAAKTLLTLTNANTDALYYPRDLMHTEAGAALTGTQGGDRALPLLAGRPKLAVTSGGGVKTGGAILFYFE